MPTLRWFGRRPVTSRPAMRIAPEVGISKPATMRKVVVLPQPEAPRNETNSPRSTARSNFCTTTCCLKLLWTSASSRNDMAR